MPKNFHFGGGVADTVITPFVLMVLVIVLGAVLFCRKKDALTALLLGCLLIPTGNILVLGGLHLPCVRIIALFAFARVVLSGFLIPANLPANLMDIDRVFLAWAFCRATAFTLLWRSSEALVNQAGFLLSTVGIYLALRYFISDKDHAFRAIKALAGVAAINAAAMVVEQFTVSNPFGFVGGFLIPNVREGRVRSQGAFAHALLAGVFGATVLPLFLLLWKAQRQKVTAAAGVMSSTVMVWTSATSTALLSYAGGFAGILLWPLRKHMRAVRWGIVLSLIGLQLVMKAPVWFLINHLDVTGASSGYHRAMLVDHFIRNFGDWWLFGTKSNAEWGAEMWDTSNEFVAEGEAGGLATFLLFLAILWRSFRRLGLSRKSHEGDVREEWFAWLLGTALFGNILAFFGAAYWDQTQVAWFALLAIICAVTIRKAGMAAAPAESEPAEYPLETAPTLLIAKGATREASPWFMAR